LGSKNVQIFENLHNNEHTNGQKTVASALKLNNSFIHSFIHSFIQEKIYLAFSPK